MENLHKKDERAVPSFARALWCIAPALSVLRRESFDAPGKEDVLVRSLYTGVSRGTEKTVFEGRVPQTEHERMRAPHMSGQFPFPVKYGYCAVGEIEAGRPELKGRPIFCLFPHQDYFVVPEAGVVLLPENLPPGRAVLAANMETALNIIWDAEVRAGDRVAVFGAGVVGILTAYLASGTPGTQVILLDLNHERRQVAERLELAFAAPDDLVGEYDVLINASGASAALSTAIDHAGLEARIVEASWYGERPVTLSLGGAFHSKRLSIVSSQVGNIAASQRPRWSFQRRLAKALDLLLDPRLDILISGETAFADLAADYARILQSPETLCHRIRY